MLEFFKKWTFVVNSNSSCEVSAHVPLSLSSQPCSIQKCDTEGGGLEDLTTCMAAGRHAEGRHPVGRQGGGGGWVGSRGPYLYCNWKLEQLQSMHDVRALPCACLST